MQPAIGAKTLDPECIAHFGATQVGLFVNGLEKAGHGPLDFIRDLVNYGVGANFDISRCARSAALRSGRTLNAKNDRPDAEARSTSVPSRTDAGMYDLELH